MSDFISGLRVAAATMAICVAGYTALILGFAQAVTPATANGSLVTNADGEIDRQPPDRAGLHVAGVLLAPALGRGLRRSGRRRLEPLSGQPGADRTGGGPDRRPWRRHRGAADPGRSRHRVGRRARPPHLARGRAVPGRTRRRGARGRGLGGCVRSSGDMAYAPGAFFTEGRIVNVLELNLALDAELAAPAVTE